MTDERNRDLESYLARIRKTISDSERLVEAAKLRMAETDRLLEKQGLTREQVLAFRFTPEQREAVNRELARQGLPPVEDDAEIPAAPAGGFAPPPPGAPLPPPADDELAERRRKFGMMMKPFQI
jgi:hypothetical protein